jgi:hypothetical protein
MFPMRDVESCEGHEPRAIAIERHESGILRDKSFDSIGEKMEPVQIGSRFKSVATSYAEAIFTPAQNVNGAVVRTATMISPAGNGFLSTGTTIPEGRWVTNVPVILSAVNGSSTLPFSVTIPAGQGLWVAMTQNGGGTAYVTYDLLP